MNTLAIFFVRKVSLAQIRNLRQVFREAKGVLSAGQDKKNELKRLKTSEWLQDCTMLVEKDFRVNPFASLHDSLFRVNGLFQPEMRMSHKNCPRNDKFRGNSS